MNHPFVDGNKRTGHAAMGTFLVLNGMENAFSFTEKFDRFPYGVLFVDR
jgi:death on curing protein